MLKLLTAEPGSDQAAEMWTTADDVAASRLAYPESRAALAAARRAGRITARGLRDATRGLSALMAEMTIVEVDRQIAVAAGDLAEAHALRGYDAVHLASALAIDDPRLVVASWDRGLTKAAVASGRHAAPA